MRCRLTNHSSQTRFAGRLNSGARPQPGVTVNLYSRINLLLAAPNTSRELDAALHTSATVTHMPLRHLFYSMILVVVPAAAFGASPEQIDAAVNAITTASYKVKLAGACGWARDARQLRHTERVAQILILKAGGFDKSLSDDDFVTVKLRAMDKELISSTENRVAVAAISGGCHDQDLKNFWSSMSNTADMIENREPR